MGPGDTRFHVERPWSAGRFAGVGHRHVYRVARWDARRHSFWLNSWAFAVADWEWEYCSDWDWTNDEIVIYDDPDHAGWYLAYNVRLGAYAHVQYNGVL